MKIGELVTLREGLRDSPRWQELGVVIEIQEGSFARIGQSYGSKRATVMWPEHEILRNSFSYEFFDDLVEVTSETR